MEIILLILLIIMMALLFSSIKIVPQQEAWLLENLGKYVKTLKPGLNFIIPVVQNVAYKHSLKEHPIDVHEQTAISQDNVSLVIDGLLYVKILDPLAASYGINDPYYAISQLAQTIMRSEIGKISLDKTFEERESLNNAIVTSINVAATNWGIQCMRYEIKDIRPPKSILQAMELQVAAERQKRAKILESEGEQQSKINFAEGEKRQVVLASEASRIDQVNRSQGEADAILLVAEATAKSIEIVAKALKQDGASEAVSLQIAEKYIESFAKLAKETNTVLLPSNIGDPSTFIAQALSVYDTLKKR